LKQGKRERPRKTYALAEERALAGSPSAPPAGPEDDPDEDPEDDTDDYDDKRRLDPEEIEESWRTLGGVEEEVEENGDGDVLSVLE
jgi:hypothetical protein